MNKSERTIDPSHVRATRENDGSVTVTETGSNTKEVFKSAREARRAHKLELFSDKVLAALGGATILYGASNALSVSTNMLPAPIRVISGLMLLSYGAITTIAAIAVHNDEQRVLEKINKLNPSEPVARRGVLKRLLDRSPNPTTMRRLLPPNRKE